MSPDTPRGGRVWQPAPDSRWRAEDSSTSGTVPGNGPAEVCIIRKGQRGIIIEFPLSTPPLYHRSPGSSEAADASHASRRTERGRAAAGRTTNEASMSSAPHPPHPTPLTSAVSAERTTASPPIQFDSSAHFATDSGTVPPSTRRASTTLQTATTHIHTARRDGIRVLRSWRPIKNRRRRPPSRMLAAQGGTRRGCGIDAG